MEMRIDDRGKFFTQHITKETVETYIQTARHTIIGQIHVRPDQRLKDALNEEHEEFLAVTDASVYDLQGEQLLFQSGFLIISHQHIEFLSPVEAVQKPTLACLQK